ncbi:D-heptose-7- phosphate 1-kinase [Synechococcus sp. PCC 7502]|uniref:D-glycero-beta-D-manno-heptose-7-phosphate kinase n=1 Tax=Synechococcus sp. PCC 7502 TaxID=1173263 RepID=UPI00029FF967|nr:D-glycero-beta-D-manno-heptose-7-phosphate kinase [Synechococcus sp. PCC 7502]AFY73206.1 D-heptose-7- phosphate 1-kinase [Synechococcus sp. PCC 7502]
MLDNFNKILSESNSQLIELIQKFDQAKVLVVGDLTLDEFLTGQVERISREAPVLIIRHEGTKQVPGGGANAIYNLAKLGAKVIAVGIIGNDDQGKALKTIFTEAGINTSGIFIDCDRPTVTKTRISAHARQSVTQQIVRIDRKSDAPISETLQTQLAQFIQAHIDQVDAIVCSDYGEGVMTEIVIDAALKHKLVVVDTQKDLDRYQGATIFTPNLPEAELAVGYGISDTNIQTASQDLLKLTNAKQILITRGENGMSLFGQDGNADHIPAFNRTQVFDVTGAGDTVVAALTLALANGGSVWAAAVLGNLAASIVVRQFGTTTTNTTEMLTALEHLLSDRPD